jgi:hypothetical protein
MCARIRRRGTVAYTLEFLSLSSSYISIQQNYLNNYPDMMVLKCLMLHKNTCLSFCGIHRINAQQDWFRACKATDGLYLWYAWFAHPPPPITRQSRTHNVAGTGILRRDTVAYMLEFLSLSSSYISTQQKYLSKWFQRWLSKCHLLYKKHTYLNSDEIPNGTLPKPVKKLDPRRMDITCPPSL